MNKKPKKDFCTACRKNTEYSLQKRDVTRNIRDKDYTFSITVAICGKCGGEMSIPGLIDKNIQQIDRQFRSAEGLVSIEDIERLMKIYKIGKAPLSLALGFGEITITRYLEGQVPSKEYSDVMKKAMTSPSYMRERLAENKDKLTDAAYNKAIAAANSLESLFSVSDKMLTVIAYIFEQIEEVTPYMLQKLLYFIQGIYSALYGEPIFEEDCRAWQHGPVYPDVYELFKDFNYDPTDDARFALLEGADIPLTANEKSVIDMVLDTYGLYGGKVLESITCQETPWKEALSIDVEGYPEGGLIPKDHLKAYYIAINEKYGISKKKGIDKYIRDMLKSA